MASKRLIIVVDSAAELNSHWQTSLRDILADIVRYLHQDGLTSQDSRARKPSLGLILYGSEGPCTEPQVLPWGWTDNLDTFLEWLSAVPFASGEFSESALSNGLSTALMTIAAVRDSSEVQVFGQTHCILVPSYKSLLSLESVQGDQTLDHERIELQKLDRFLNDAASVAKNFVQSFVSLSVISPKHSPRLSEIFRAGNVYKPRAGYCTHDRKNLNYLVLLSDNFMEAHAALNYRDFAIKPADENFKGKGIDFGTYLIPFSKEKGPDGDAEMIGDNFTKVFPINQPQTSLVDMLTHVEAWLMESDDDDDINGMQDNTGESSTNQYDALTNNLPTVDVMASFQDATSGTRNR